MLGFISQRNPEHGFRAFHNDKADAIYYN